MDDLVARIMRRHSAQTDIFAKEYKDLVDIAGEEIASELYTRDDPKWDIAYGIARKLMIRVKSIKEVLLLTKHQMEVEKRA